MMDAQKQERLTHEQVIEAANRMYEASPEMAMKIKTYTEKLEQIVHEQEETIKELSSVYELQFGALNQQLRDQLAKYERVVEAARHLITKARDSKTITGDNGQPDWYEYSAQDFDVLMDAVDSLKA